MWRIDVDGSIVCFGVCSIVSIFLLGLVVVVVVWRVLLFPSELGVVVVVGMVTFLVASSVGPNSWIDANNGILLEKLSSNMSNKDE